MADKRVCWRDTCVGRCDIYERPDGTYIYVISVEGRAVMESAPYKDLANCKADGYARIG